MKISLKLLVCCYFLATINIAHSQQNNSGKVTISEAELASIAAMFKKHKLYKDSIASQEIVSKKKEATQVKENVISTKVVEKPLVLVEKTDNSTTKIEETTKNSISEKVVPAPIQTSEKKLTDNKISVDSKNNDNLYAAELVKLQEEIKNLKTTLNDYIVKQSTSSKVQPHLIKETKVITTAPIVKTEYKEKLITKYDTVYVENGGVLLQSKKDSLEIALLTKKIQQLKLELTSRDSIKTIELQPKKITPIIQKENGSNALIVPKTEASNVFFENNSFLLSDVQKEALQNLIKVIPTNSYLYLKGFASNVGNAAYNKILSKNRIDTVKKYLIENGVNSGRIFTENNGIDLNAIDESQARRVEIDFLEKR